MPLGWLALLACAPSCTTTPAATTPIVVTIATGSTAGLYYPLGTSLARVYSQRVAGVMGKAIQTGASPANVDALQTGTADIGFALGDTAYLAYTEGTRLNSAPHRRLRSIAVLYQNASHFIVAPNSRIRSLRDLEGTRVRFGVASVVGGRSRTLDLLLLAHGVEPGTVDVRPDTFDAIVAGLRDGSVDVGVISAGFPVPTIEAAAKRRTALSGRRPAWRSSGCARNIRSSCPSPFRPDTYTAQSARRFIPWAWTTCSCAVKTSTRSWSTASRRPSSRRCPIWPQPIHRPRSSTPNLAPATAIPLHGGAARYYRERELLLY